MAASGKTTMTQGTGAIPASDLSSGQAATAQPSNLLVLKKLQSADPVSEVKKFADFCSTLATDPATQEATYEEISKQLATVPKLSDDIKKFYQDSKRQGTKFALEHVASEAALVVALAIRSFDNKQADCKEPKVVLQFGGPILQSIIAMETILEGQGLNYFPKSVIQARTEDVLLPNGNHKDATRSFPSIDGKASASVAELKNSEVYVLQCIGTIKDAERGKVDNHIPPTDDVFASLMRYHLKHDVAAINVVCGSHHDVTKLSDVAVIDAKTALENFCRNHADWMKGANIPAKLLGDKNAGKGNRIDFLTVDKILKFPAYVSLVTKLNEVFLKDITKRQLFLKSIIDDVVKHLIEKFMRHNGFKDKKSMRAHYHQQAAKKNRQERHASLLRVSPKGKSSTASTSKSSGSGSGSGSEHPSPVGTGSTSSSDVDEDVLNLSKKITRTAKIVADSEGVDFDTAKDVVVEVMEKKGQFGDRSSSPPRADKKENRHGVVSRQGHFGPKPLTIDSDSDNELVRHQRVQAQH